VHVSEPTLDYHIDSTTEGLNIFIYILYLLKLTALPVHVSEPTLDYHIDSTTEGLNIFIYILYEHVITKVPDFSSILHRLLSVASIFFSRVFLVLIL
jgi:hypothetical protein